MLIHYIDKLFFTACILNATLFLPQIRLLYKTKESSSVSLAMFMCFNIIQAITVLHGYLHNDLYLCVGFTLSFISCSCVTALIIYYRIKKEEKNWESKHISLILTENYLILKTTYTVFCRLVLVRDIMKIVSLNLHLI